MLYHSDSEYFSGVTTIKLTRSLPTHPWQQSLRECVSTSGCGLVYVVISRLLAIASVPEVESEIRLTTDLQEVSLEAGNSVFLSFCF